jgi:hypothetical protein
MNKAVLVVALTLVLMVTAACSGGQSASPDGTGVRSSETTTANETPAPDGFEPIPTDGPGESAALATLPGALAEGKRMRETAGYEWPDLTGLEPRLTAYLVRVDYAGQVALFEVRADGIAHNLYAYQRPFDSGSIVWSPADSSQGPTAEPRSDREKAAVAAVRAAMEDAFPGEPMSFAVQGYRFVYLDGGNVVLQIEVDPEGGVLGVGN